MKLSLSLLLYQVLTNGCSAFHLFDSPSFFGFLLNQTRLNLMQNVCFSSPSWIYLVLFYYVVIKCPKSEHHDSTCSLRAFSFIGGVSCLVFILPGITRGWLWGNILSFYFLQNNAHTLAVTSHGNPFQKNPLKFSQKRKERRKKEDETKYCLILYPHTCFPFSCPFLLLLKACWFMAGESLSCNGLVFLHMLW